MKHSKLAAPAKRFPSLLGILMIIASCGETSECKSNGLDYKSTTNEIVCQNSPQELGQNGTAVLTFYCYWNWEAVSNGSIGNSYERGAEVTFTATGGTCTSSAISDEKGVVTCVFTATDPANFKGGTVTASLRVFSRSMDGRYDDMNTYRTAVGQILPGARPSKEKTKPKIKIIGEEKPVIGEDGKSKLIFELSERAEGETADRVIPGTEVKFESNKPDQVTLTPEKAVTDEKGQVTVEMEAKDKDAYEGSEVTAKAEVRYSDGNVPVETTVRVEPNKKITYTLTCTNLPQVVNAEQNPLTFKISKAVEGMEVTAPVYGATVSFTAENGTVTPESATTDGRGEVSAQFKFSGDDIMSYTGGSVTATATVEGQALTCTAPIDPLEHVEITCTDSPQTIDENGKAALTFSVIHVNGATREPIANTKVQFTASKGKCTAEGTTDSNGNVKAEFETGEVNLEDFDEATITATCTYDGKSYSGIGVVSGLDWTYNVECLDPQQTISAKYLGKAIIWFKLTATSGSITKPLKHRTFAFTATNGKVETSSMSIYTDEDGQMAADFFPDDDIYWFEGATVTATFESSDGKTASAQGIVKGLDWTYTVACTNSGQAIDKDGKASLDFEVLAETDHPTEGHVKRLPSKALIAFSSSDGSVSPASGLTNDEGKATVVFQTSDVENFTEGKVTGAFDGTINGKTVKDQPHVKTEGTVVGLPKDGLDKPRGLNDNTYVIQKNGGEEQVFKFEQGHSEWSVKDGDLSVMLYNADEYGSTNGMVWGYMPWETVGTAVVLDHEFYNNNPHAKLNFEHYEGGASIFAHPGNMKESSRLLVQPVPTASLIGRRGRNRAPEYSGNLQMLFYYEFTIDGEDYIAYGKGTMHEHVPVISYFRLKEENTFMMVGDKYTVEIDYYSEEAVPWDWNDVQLIAQASDYSGWADNKDEGYFSWDAASHTLTALKACSNVYPVYLKFALKSRPGVTCQHRAICVGEGWPYTSFTISPAEQEIGPYNSIQFKIQWEPASEPWDPAAIEIDPDSNKNDNYHYIGNSSYGTYGTLYMWRQSNPVYGTETLTFRLKSNHSVKASMKITLKPDE